MAHHVLLVLATFADRTGMARPGVSTVASEAFLGVPTVRTALDRLSMAGLIAEAGDFNGTTVWRLNLSVTRPSDAIDEQRQRTIQARRKGAERVRRHRERARVDTDAAGSGVDGNGVGRRDVTPSDGVTDEGCNAVGHRYVTPCDSVSNGVGQRYVTPSGPLHGQVRPPVTAIGTATELPIELPSLAAAPRENRDNGPTEHLSTVDAEGFERFWSAYPRRVAKGRARAAWAKALGTGTSVEVILAGAARYAAARDGQDPRYTAHPATWLSGERWTDEPTPARPAGTSGAGWAPYRNPDDQSVYDQPLI